jgi:trehalose 6-phosphate synthase/phosphatase
VRRDWLEQWRQAQDRLLFLDYDGTLREFTERPEQAVPDADLLELLTALSRAGGVEVWVVSGRPPRILADWLGGTGVGLIAEHGAMIRAPGESEFVPLFHIPHPTWKPGVLEVMQTFVDRVPHSLIEEKPYSAAWHYRASDPGVGPWQAAELGQHLSEILANLPLEVLSGNKVVEVRLQGVDKGSAVMEVLRKRVKGEVPILAAGDDRTDEDLFQRLPKNSMSLLVGKRESSATCRLDSPHDLRVLLSELLTILEGSESRPDSVAGGVG